MEIWNRFRTGLRALAASGAAASMLLAACGGGGGDDDATSGAADTAVRLESAATASATIGAAGGTVTAVAADGRRYTLTVPAGALAADTAITATPIVSMGNAPLADGLRGGVRFGPSGLSFGLAATLRIEGASTTASAGKRLVGFVRSDDGAAMQLVPVEVVGNALEMPVPHFSDGGAAEASAAELAAIPLAPITDPVQDLWDTLMREIRVGGTEADDIDVIVRLHDQKVVPLLQTAESLADDPTQDRFRESAVATWAAWQRIVDISGLPAEVFGGRVVQARARSGAMLLDQVERGRSACLEPAPLRALHLDGMLRALWAQKVAQAHRLDAPDLGLDAFTVPRRLNDCARVAFVPRPLPAFEAGRAVSLDAQADLIFAADVNAQDPMLFRFEVQSADASVATPLGFASEAGQYTTVVTPTASDPQFDVRACVVTFMANSAPVSSVLCGRQTLPGDPGVILAGTIDLFADLNQVDTLVGEMSLRVRANPDGSFTVVEALGSYRIRETISGNCTPAGGGPLVTRSLSASIDGIVTGARVFREQGQPFVLEGTSRETGSFQELRDDCSVATQTVDRTRAIGPVPFFRIERDAQGVPLFIDIGFDADAILGRLVRQ
jgi:hypothetical protein